MCISKVQVQKQGVEHIRFLLVNVLSICQIYFVCIDFVICDSVQEMETVHCLC